MGIYRCAESKGPRGEWPAEGCGGTQRDSVNSLAGLSGNRSPSCKYPWPVPSHPFFFLGREGVQVQGRVGRDWVAAPSGRCHPVEAGIGIPSDGTLMPAGVILASKWVKGGVKKTGAWTSESAPTGGRRARESLVAGWMVNFDGQGQFGWKARWESEKSPQGSAP